MKRTILFTFLAFVFVAAFAQNYQLVQPGVTRYFTNEGHYLRASRVDSVKTIGSDTVLYLFRTPRGKHVDANQTPLVLDTNGGSWLGKTIRIQPGGLHHILNYWGDTVVIMAQAQLNDSWAIYDDTTDYSYEATVTAVSQENVLGQLDSVKTITIIAKYQNNVNTADPLHNGVIRISKNHGLVTSYDLYMFPLHEPGKTATKGFDYFTDKAGISASTIIAYQSLEAALNDADSLNKYLLNPGDALQRGYTYQSQSLPSGLTYSVYDSIISASQSGAAISYFANNIHTMNEPAGSVTSEQKATLDAASLYSTLKTGYLAGTPDAGHLPEETGQPSFIWYNPGDTTYCMTSPGYKFYETHIGTDGKVNTFEPISVSAEYKLGLGMTKYHWVNVSTGPLYNQNLTYVKRGSKRCGNASINVEKQDALQYSLYPNPANERLIVKMINPGTAHIWILNTMGQKMATVTTEKSEVTLPVNELANGVYYLLISDDEGRTKTEKLMVQH